MSRIEGNRLGPTVPKADREMSLFAIGSLALRHKWRIARWTFAGAVVAAATVVARPPLYLATASFAPQGNDASRAGLASLAGQFGVALPNTGQTLSPEYYARLLKSRTLLRSLVLDTFVVQEQSGNRATFLDLFEINGANQALREDLGVEQLSKMVGTSVSKPTGIVEVTAETKWRSVSLALVSALISGVNDFNQRSRQSQAGAERKFVEGRLTVADSDLRSAEERIGQFLRSNRQYTNSPELVLEHDRLERAVSQRQQVYTTLAQSYEEARIREVRDTPVITVVESPSAPMLPQPRGRSKVVLLGILLGGFVGVVLVTVSDTMVRGRMASDTEASEFVSELDALKHDIARPYQWIVARLSR